MTRLLFLNNLRWFYRLPAKWGLVGLVLLVVCFPYPMRLLHHVQHWQNPNALVEPDAPALAPLADELSLRLSDDLTDAEALRRVERFVYEKIPYDWDWNTWGMADYLPTVAEAVEMGREDCDGRAVVAASLMKRLGYDAEIVTDFSHVWVKTNRGDWMSPGKTRAIVATKDGLQMRLAGLLELPKATAYGAAVFPLSRELIILFVAWWMLLRKGGGLLCGACSLGLMVGGLMLLRVGGRDFFNSVLWMQWCGMFASLFGVCLLWTWARRNARRAGLERPSVPDAVV